MPSFSNTKLARLLSLLQPKECKLFARWLDSPWCNRNPRLAPFLRLLMNYYPRFDQPRCHQEHLYAQLFPEKPFQSKSMRQLMSELSKQIEQFLIQQQLQKKPQQQRLLLQEAFLERHQTEWFEKSSQRTITELEAQPTRSWMDLLQLCLLNEGLYFQPDTTVRHQPEQRVLHRANHYLDAFYALVKYRLAFEFEERRKIMRGKQEVEVDLPALRNLKDRIQDPALLIFEEHLSIEQPLALERYYEIKDLTLGHMDSLSMRNQRDFLYALINQATRFVAQGQPNARQELLELYQVGINRNLLLMKKRITGRTFSNIVSVSNSLGRHDLALDFSENYSVYLKPELKVDALVWARGHTHYYAGEFENVVDVLINHSFSVYLYDLQSRRLLLQSYFDLLCVDISYEEYFFHYSGAFEKYIRRGKFFNASQQRAHLFFLTNTRKLASMIIKKQTDNESLEKFLSSLEEEKGGHGKFWLQSKVKELRK